MIKHNLLGGFIVMDINNMSEEIKKKLSDNGIVIPEEYKTAVIEKVQQEINHPAEINENSLNVVSGGASNWLKENWGKIAAAV